jgi:hypothetical protein
MSGLVSASRNPLAAASMVADCRSRNERYSFPAGIPKHMPRSQEGQDPPTRQHSSRSLAPARIIRKRSGGGGEELEEPGELEGQIEILAPSHE